MLDNLNDILPGNAFRGGRGDGFPTCALFILYFSFYFEGHLLYLLAIFLQFYEYIYIYIRIFLRILYLEVTDGPVICMDIQ